MYRLTVEEQLLVARAAALADEKIAPHAVRVDREGVFPSASLQALAEAGLFGLLVPVEHGGQGLRLRAAMAVLEELGQRCGSTAMVFLMHLCGSSCYVAEAARNPAGPFPALLREVAAGRHLSTLAWSEKGSRSHFWAPVGTARAEGDTVVLDAVKSWVTTAGHADGYVATSTGAGGEGIDLYLVKAGDPGWTITGGWDGVGLRGNASNPMTLAGCRIPAERRMGPAGGALEIMLGVVLPVFQLGCAVIATGLAEASIRLTTGHLTSSRLQHLDWALSDLPVLRARLAQMRIITDRARAHISVTLDSVEEPTEATTLLVLESKASAADAARETTELAMLACGGAAFSRHLEVERCFRDCRAMSVMAPTSDAIREFVGRALVGLPVFG
ncbi:MAG: acyl-CoA dehydrogenase family protein [Candidatus Delongbacteria bacterium]